MKLVIINRSRSSVPRKRIQEDVKKSIQILRNHGILKKFAVLTIVFVKNQESWRLNKAFLRKNQPANVLSFDYGREAELILAPELLRREALLFGHSALDYLRWMVVHGLLHLMGRHHESSKKEERSFETLEDTLRKKLHIRIP